MFDFVSKRRWFFILSAIIIAAGIISMASPGGLHIGTEFRAGTSLEIELGEGVTILDLRTRLTELGHGGAMVQEFGDEGHVFVRTGEMSAAEKSAFEAEMAALGDIVRSEYVSPMIAADTVRNAAIAVFAASIAILLYITFAFRRMPKPFRYGACAIFALVHDVLIVLSVFSLLGRIFGWQIDPMFVTAVLAVIGYSVNDTIVVFDRIRETLTRAGQNYDFPQVVNASLTGTLNRSLNTSVTTILAVLAVYLFIGGTVQTFVMALLVGIISGTYSSIFIAAQLLVRWEQRGLLAGVPVLGRIGRKAHGGISTATT